MSGHIGDDNDNGSSGSKLREWSSLIGIVTAIAGNILISFALNIQRYAHLRLERDRERVNPTWKDRSRKAGKQNYGTQQSQIAEERARVNLSVPFTDQSQADGQDTPDNRDGTSKARNQNKNERPISLHSRRSSDSSVGRVEKQASGQAKKNYLKSPYWWLGLVFMVVGEAGNFLAYGFAPASTVSPLGVVALISNCIIAPCLLKERFRQRDFWGVCVAIAGAVVIVLSAKNSETKMGPDDIWSAITRWEFETYIGITVAFIIILMWASGKYGERTILIDVGLVALFGGYTALTTKGVASLLSDTLWRTLTFPITYLLVVILVLTALMQIRYINRALQRFNSTQVIPTQFVLFTISVIVGSAVLYRDFKSATRDQMGKFIGGCLLTFLGVYLITSGRNGGSGYEVRGISDVSEGPIHLVDEERYQDEEVISQRTQDDIERSQEHHTDGTQSRRSSHQVQTSSKPSHSSSPVPESKDLLANPWQSADDLGDVRPPPLDGTVSSPVLPSEARRTALATSPDYEPSEQHTTENFLTPNREISMTPARGSLSRRSISHLTPGPYLSPLSSSLSAVVVDSIRRGHDSPSKYSRPRLSGMRNSTSQRGAAMSSEDIPTTTTPLRTSETQEDGDDSMPLEDASTGRRRSLSKTLGEFFRMKKERNKGKQSQSSEEGETDQ